MVLVVTLLIVTLGSVALSMSLSNVRMSAKVKNYNKEYYDLEKAAEEVLEKIDIKLKGCEDNALNYLKEEHFRNPYKSETDPHIQNFKYPGGNQIFFNEKWKKDVFDKSLYSVNDGVVNPVVYEKKFHDYFDQSFNRIYFSYAQKVMEEFVRTFNSTYTNENINCKVELKLNNDKNYNKAYSYANWGDFDLNSGDLNLQLTFENKVGRKIKAEVSVIPPHYTAISKEEKKAYRANPIWTNALVAYGDITFKRGNFTLYGDLVSMNDNIKSSIIFKDNVRLNSYGNILASGDVMFEGQENIVNVRKADGSYDAEFKKSLFGNEFLFKDDEVVIFPRDITSARPIQLYEGSTHKDSTGVMPMYFNDIMGGNVYCSKVSIGNMSQNSSIILRNLMVSDGIELYSLKNSSITIENILIGTGRSSNGDIFLPDSATLSNGNKFNLPPNYITNGNSKLSKNYNESMTKNRFNILTSKYIDTNPHMDNPLYNVLKYKTTKLGTPNRNFLGMVYEDVLKGIKDPNIIKMTYYEGNKDLVLNNETKNTIIYCSGDLNIRGNGTINGVVIAKGNINLEGDVKIKYDETVIKNALRESLYVEKFFSVCEIGKGITVGIDENNKPITYRKDVSNNPRARSRISKDRYSIVKWNRK